MEGNILINNSKSLYSGRSSSGDGISAPETSKQQNDSSTRTSNYNRNKEDDDLGDSQKNSGENGEISSVSHDSLEAYKYQKTGNQKVKAILESTDPKATDYIQDTLDRHAERNVTTIKKARNRIGDVIFYNNEGNTHVTRSVIPKNTITNSQMGVVDNTNNKSSENLQEQHEIMQLEAIRRHPIQYHSIADTNNMAVTREVQNESFKENRIELGSNLKAFETTKIPQFISSEFVCSLLTEDISPNERYDTSNVIVPGSSPIDESSLTNELAWQNKTVKEKTGNTSAQNPSEIFGNLETMEKLTADSQLTKVCLDGRVCPHGILRSTSPITFTPAIEKPNKKNSKEEKTIT
ncbi:hypothetical protein JTE90_008093 [Oedothorax gibbosus]|uniref:Uncharacterized protein n=1 Tax=Oedothorax gibbosus TaxID=931172 RepID=A0AAV6UZ43_9ARAC|nr:hypothetical protein JTE90_008093 [Oedothorax gibbosus]